MPEEMQKQIIKEESNGRRQAMEEIHTQNLKVEQTKIKHQK